MSEGRITAADRAEARFNWLSTTQVAARLDCSTGHVRNLMKSGELTYANLADKGKRPEYKIMEKWLDAFLARRTENADAA